VIISSGVEPFDGRVGGLRAGELYLLAGAPGSGKLAFLLQFLAAGLEADERLAFLGGHTPEELFAQARHWGIPGLEDAWRRGRLLLLGFRGEYPRRILHASDPEEAFTELTAALEGPVSRLAVDPGTLLWETRAGNAMAASFIQWQETSGASVVATALTDFEQSPLPSTDWVARRAAGVFRLTRSRGSLRDLTVYGMRPPIDDPGSITLELKAGTGLSAPSGRPRRRAGDVAADDRRRLLFVRFADVIGEDVERWLKSEYEVHDVRDPARLLSLLEAEAWGGVCIGVDRSGVEKAVDLCRAIRERTAGVIVVLSRGQLRSSDRARAIEAGADDVIREDVALRELKSRFRRPAALAGGGEAVTGLDRPAPLPDLLDPVDFEEELRRRLDSPSLGYLSLILVPRTVGAEALRALRDGVRIRAGDFVGQAAPGYGIVLQDARGRHARIYLERALRALDPSAGAPEVKILTSPEEGDAIRAALSGDAA
jgi:KaiC/GvpD/RAD55 family RecA-like ATPase/CheY-like chemotaxis protein